MPIKRIQFPDGSIKRVEVPDGATDDQILQFVQSQYQVPQESRQQRYERILAENEARQPSGSSDRTVVARQTFDASPWYAKPFIAAGGELTSLGRSAQQLVTPDDSEYGRALQGRIDADAPMQDGIHGVSGFVGRALPYLATLPLGGPEAALLGRAGNVGRVGQLAIRGGAAAAEGAAYGAAGETRTGESRLVNAGLGAVGGVAGRGIVGTGRGIASGFSRKADSILRADIDTAMREGIPLHVSQVAQSTPTRLAASLARYLPFSGAGAAARNQQNAWNRALTGHAGEATDRLDDVWLASRKNAFDDTYDAIWGRNSVTVSPQAAARMQQVVKDAYRDLGTEGGRVVENQFNRILDDVARANQGGMISGRNYQTLASDLASVQPGTQVGKFVGRIRRELVGEADASVNPADMALKRQTDRQYNNFKTLKRLLTRPAGARADISPAALWGAVNARGPKATQEFHDLARVGYNMLKDPIPQTGIVGSQLSGLLTGGASYAAGGLLPALGVVGAGITAGRALNSPTVGSLVARNAGKANVIAKLLEAEGKAGALRRGAGRATTMAAAANAPALQLDIVGGTPGAAPTPEEIEMLRARARAAQAGN